MRCLGKNILIDQLKFDAIAFSSYLADELLNVKQVIPDEIKEKGVVTLE